jgi:hypothetical protein
MGIICRLKHLDVHELCVKAGSFFPEDSGKASLIVARAASNAWRNGPA